jgi:hypothetical protein
MYSGDQCGARRKAKHQESLREKRYRINVFSGILSTGRVASAAARFWVQGARNDEQTDFYGFGRRRFSGHYDNLGKRFGDDRHYGRLLCDRSRRQLVQQ